MAKTGIKIQISDSVLGAPVDVNATSMLLTTDLFATGGESSVVKGRSVADFKSTINDPSDLLEAITTYFNPSPLINLEGNLLWAATLDDMDSDTICNVVRSTVQDSFDDRPRQLVFLARGGSEPYGGATKGTVTEIQSAISQLASEGIRVVAVVCTLFNAGGTGSVPTAIVDADDVTTWDAPFVAVCPMSATSGELIDGGVYVAATLATQSVGVSIGDGGLAAIQTPSFLAASDDLQMMISDDVRTLSLAQVNMLGEKGYLFTRTRPPRAGLWWNDGATCNNPANALSTLEAARTICALADDLQSFFVPYINTRVPVTSTGDIQSTYKQVVLDNARAAVVQKYIESGDISDARIKLVAKNNDMIGTRTWEVTLSILPAPTLRWIDGYVFYVKSL